MHCVYNRLKDRECLQQSVLQPSRCEEHHSHPESLLSPDFPGEIRLLVRAESEGARGVRVK